MSWSKAKAHLEEVQTQLQGLKDGEHAYNYQLRYVKDAERAEKWWLERLGNYGRGTIVQVTGQMGIQAGDKFAMGLMEVFPTSKPFTCFLINVNTDEVKEYLMARFPLIKKETIELKEFQTGILNV